MFLYRTTDSVKLHLLLSQGWFLSNDCPENFGNSDEGFLVSACAEEGADPVFWGQEFRNWISRRIFCSFFFFLFSLMCTVYTNGVSIIVVQTEKDDTWKILVIVSSMVQYVWTCILMGGCLSTRLLTTCYIAMDKVRAFSCNFENTNHLIAG